VRAAILVGVLAWAGSAVADDRVAIDLASVAAGPPVAIRPGGIAGFLEGARVPADLDDMMSRCTMNRSAAVVRPDGMAYEIVARGDQTFLDEADFTTEDGTWHFTGYRRRPVTIVAQADDVVLWAYREHGSLHIGTFADFGRNDRYTSFGCRWREVTILERGGTSRLSSDPSMSDPPRDVFTELHVPKAKGPTFWFAASVSRSSTDTAPVVVVRMEVRRS
jgi:hypothetical protein